MQQEQTGQFYPDKGIDQGVWTKGKPGGAGQDAPKTIENEREQAKAKVRPDK